MRQLWFLFLLLVSGVAWGIEFSALKLAVQGGHDELTILMIALVLITICYFLILLVRAHFAPSDKGDFCFSGRYRRARLPHSASPPFFTPHRICPPVS